jgi:hypothetical protein
VIFRRPIGFSFVWGRYLVHCYFGVYHCPRYSIYYFGLWSYWKMHWKDEREFESGWGGNWELSEEEGGRC